MRRARDVGVLLSALLAGAPACATSTPHATRPLPRDPCAGRPPGDVRDRLSRGELLSALAASKGACIDAATNDELEKARAWLARPGDIDVMLREADVARGGDPVQARRLFDRVAAAMQRAGSPPHWELPPASANGTAVFLSDARVVSLAGNAVALIDVRSGARRLLSPPARLPINTLVRSDDGRRFAATTADQVLLWDGVRFVGILPVAGAREIAFSDGSVGVLARDGVTLWNTNTAQLTVTRPRARDLVFVKGELVVDEGDAVRVVEAATGRVSATLATTNPSGPYWRLKVSPDRELLLRQWQSEGERAGHTGIDIWKTARWRHVGSFDTGHYGLTEPTFSRDGRWLFAGTGTWLAVLDLVNRKLETAWNIGSSSLVGPLRRATSVRALVDGPSLTGPVRVVALTPDDRRVMACADIVPCLLVDWHSGKYVGVDAELTLLADGSVLSAAFAASGARPSKPSIRTDEHLHEDAVAESVRDVVPTTSDQWRATNRLFTSLERCGSGQGLSTSADGKWVLREDQPGRPCVWSRDDGHLMPRPAPVATLAPLSAFALYDHQLLLGGVGAAGPWERAVDLRAGQLVPLSDVQSSRLRANPLLGAAAVVTASDGEFVVNIERASHVTLSSVADGRVRLSFEVWSGSAPELLPKTPEGVALDPNGELPHLSRCVRGGQDVAKELCAALWRADDVWRTAMH